MLVKSDYDIVYETLISLKVKFDALRINEKQLVIWGMGNTDSLYYNAFRYDKTPIKYYVNNSKKEIPEHNGFNVIRPSAIQNIDNPLIIINAQNKGVILSIISDIKTLGQAIDYALVSEYFCYRYHDIFISNLSLLDEISAHIYAHILLNLLGNSANTKDLYNPDHYFAIPEFCIPDKDEVYVDVGAYVGDSLELYCFRKFAQFHKYYCFEPDPENFAALNTRIKRLNSEWNLSPDKIQSVNGGIGEKAGKMPFCKSRSAESNFSQDITNITIPIYTLDEYFCKEHIDVIKADVEGWEFPLLLGSKNVITRDHPLLAISIYHNLFDYINIINFLKNLHADYRFAVRHHSYICNDTVLYAF